MSSSITEILVVKSANRQSFTIDTGVNEVDIAIGASIRYLEDSNVASYFQRLDSPLVLGAGVFLPYCYSLSTLSLNVFLTWIADNGIGAVSAASINIPVANQEVSLVGGSASPGLFLKHPGLTDPTWTGKARLTMAVLSGKVSMINNPAALTGALNVIPWLRVQHSLPLLNA